MQLKLPGELSKESRDAALILLAPIFAAPVGKMTGVVLGPLFLIPAFLMVAGMAPDVFRRPRS